MKRSGLKKSAVEVRQLNIPKEKNRNKLVFTHYSDSYVYFLCSNSNLMTVISMMKLYDLLAAKLDREIAENLTNFIDSKIKEELEAKKQSLATKEDLAVAKVDLIKWMVALWITNTIMIIGLYFRK